MADQHWLYGQEDRKALGNLLFQDSLISQVPPSACGSPTDKRLCPAFAELSKSFWTDVKDK